MSFETFSLAKYLNVSKKNRDGPVENLMRILSATNLAYHPFRLAHVNTV